MMKVRRPAALSATENGSSSRDVLTVTPIDKKLISGIYQNVQRIRVLERLSSLQIPFPSQLPDITEENTFPLDITRVDDVRIRQQLSYWAAQFARVNALLALARSERKRLDRKVDREEKIAFRVYSPDRKSTSFVDKVWGEVYSQQHIKAMHRKQEEALQMEEILDGLARDFQTYYEICSREMTWRMSERKAMMP